MEKSHKLIFDLFSTLNKFDTLLSTNDQLSSLSLSSLSLSSPSSSPSNNTNIDISGTNTNINNSENNNQSTSQRWPTLHKLFIKQQKLSQQPNNNHLKPFQFETKRVSLHQPKAYTNIVAVVSFDNVLSDKHQDLDDVLKSTNQSTDKSTNKSTDKSNTPTSTISPSSVSTTSIESVVSDRLKGIVSSNNSTS